MFNHIYIFLNNLDTLFWGYLGFIIIALVGLFFSFKLQFFQITSFFKIFSNIKELISNTNQSRGIHPLKAFFSSMGGMIGIGNIVGVATAVQIGGPGALFWIWITAPLGAIIKYSEIFLGLKYRIPNNQGGYDGGPMFFLQKAFKSKAIPFIAAILLCIYGIEIYQFSVITTSISQNFGINKLLILSILLILVGYAGKGGIPRIAKISTFIMPFFAITYIALCFFIISIHFSIFPKVLMLVFQNAFKTSSAIGGFAGASLIIAIKQGISRAAYSGDIGIGYASIIQSESSHIDPKKQGLLAIIGVFIDNLICSLSVLVLLVTGVWNANIEGSDLVQKAFSMYFPYMQYLMPCFLFIAGYSTIIAYFGAGIKCAKFLHQKHGPKLYFIYAALSFILFSFLDQTTALLIMSLSGGALVIINLLGMFILQKEITKPNSKKISISDGVLE